MSNRPASLFIASLSALAALALAAPAQSKDVLSVLIDEAKVAKIPENAVTLVVGNPIVADVTMLKGTNSMVLTGKSFGETNVIALDAKGDVLDEETIRVHGGHAVLVVQRGFDRTSYACNPECMPTVELGDSKTWFDDASNQAGSRTSAARGSAGASGMQK